jgi:hypothetical protein
MATDVFQGSQQSPNVSTDQTTTTAPDWYNNYLQDIANLGQNAVANSGVAGLSPLQTQAMNMAPTAAFAGSGTLGDAASLEKASGTTSAPSIVQNYMNPYVHNVVDEMGRQQQMDIQNNVMPGLSAAGAATGNFGSSRMANATGQTLANMQANLTGQQYGALNTGYNQAMTNAQADLNRELQSGQSLNTTGVDQNSLANQGLKTLSDLGGIQQTTAQNYLDQPMKEATQFANLEHGYNIPTSTTDQKTSSGAYTNSPLADVSGLVSLINSYNNGSTKTLSSADVLNNTQTAKARGYTINSDGTYTDAKGKIYNSDLTPKVAQGGSIVKMADGGMMGSGLGSVAPQVYNDAVGGSTNTFAYGGHVFDHHGNRIG